MYGISGGANSPMGSMIKWGGRPPSGLGHMPETPLADEVNDAVSALMRQPLGRVPALVLKCEYLTPGKPMESKLQELREEHAETLSRVRYYQHLQTGRRYVAGWLRIPFSIDASLLVEIATREREGLV